jgi:hypothetical protein
MNEQELLVDSLRRIGRSGIRYMLTGSMASNYWGVPRTTHDLDFVVQFPPSAVSRLVEQFRQDYYVDEEAVKRAFVPPHQFIFLDNRSAVD